MHVHRSPNSKVDQVQWKAALQSSSKKEHVGWKNINNEKIHQFSTTKNDSERKQHLHKFHMTHSDTSIIIFTISLQKGFFKITSSVVMKSQWGKSAATCSRRRFLFYKFAASEHGITILKPGKLIFFELFFLIIVYTLYMSDGLNLLHPRKDVAEMVIVFCVSPIIPESFMIISSINVLV